MPAQDAGLTATFANISQPAAPGFSRECDVDLSPQYSMTGSSPSVSEPRSDTSLREFPTYEPTLGTRPSTATLVNRRTRPLKSGSTHSSGSPSADPKHDRTVRMRLPTPRNTITGANPAERYVIVSPGNESTGKRLKKGVFRLIGQK